MKFFRRLLARWQAGREATAEARLRDWGSRLLVGGRLDESEAEHLAALLVRAPATPREAEFLARLQTTAKSPVGLGQDPERGTPTQAGAPDGRVRPARA